MTTDILAGLNSKQREAVETVEGPLLIIAGPGSGKTRVITHRIAYLVRVAGVTPYRIAAVTFTNKAAREMRLRLDALLGPAARDLTAGTFHSFCAMILRREGGNIGLNNNFAIYDDSDQVSLIKRSMKEVDVDPKRFSPRAIQSAMSSAKSVLLGVEGFGMKKETYFDEIVHRVYERYDHLISQSGAVDFDDLLLKTYFLFENFPDVAKKYQERYVHFMIDEFQDTNVVQYAIARQLSQTYRNLCVVGDPDQSIYSWRNADIRNILSFQSDYAEAKTIALEENYRSTQTILDAAQNVIAPNSQRVEKNLWTKNGQGVPIVLKEEYNEQDEARFVVKEIQNLTRNKGYDLGDIAVMYRVNAQSRALEESCLRYGVPYQVVGGQKFYQRQEVKDVAAYLRLVANPHDDVALARVVNVPTRGIGQ
ncbi:MAG: UvrD-helicase domain-containing protein, partial [Chloroflexi bacterium]|nr:UvrD-helicase domain-containing protein [Chloroflexota bacterium]